MDLIPFLFNVEYNLEIYNTGFILDILEKNPTGVIAFPDNHNSALIYYYETKEFKKINFSGIGEYEQDEDEDENEDEKYGCCSTIENGAIAFPYNTKRAVLFDASSETFTEIGPSLENHGKFICSISFDGGAIAFPWNFNKCMLYCSDTQEVILHEILGCSDSGYYNNVVIINSKVFAFSTGSGPIIEYNILNKELKTFKLDGIKDIFYAFAVENKIILFSTAKDKFLIFNPKNSEIKISKTKHDNLGYSGSLIEGGAFFFSTDIDKILVYSSETESFEEIFNLPDGEQEHTTENDENDEDDEITFYDKVASYGDKIFAFNGALLHGNGVLIYDQKLKTLKKIIVKNSISLLPYKSEIDEDNRFFIDIIQINDEVILFPEYFGRALLFNCKTEKVEMIGPLLKEKKDIVAVL